MSLYVIIMTTYSTKASKTLIRIMMNYEGFFLLYYKIDILHEEMTENTRSHSSSKLAKQQSKGVW